MAKRPTTPKCQAATAYEDDDTSAYEDATALRRHLSPVIRSIEECIDEGIGIGELLELTTVTYGLDDGFRIAVKVGESDGDEQLQSLGIACNVVMRELFSGPGLKYFEHLLASAMLRADKIAANEMERILQNAAFVPDEEGESLLAFVQRPNEAKPPEVNCDDEPEPEPEPEPEDEDDDNADI